MDPKHILPKVAAGEANALRELVEQYGDLLWSLARRFTRSEADAEEAVQDVLVYLWKKAPKFDPSRGEEVTFVSVVARRRLIDRYRKETRHATPAQLPEEMVEANNGTIRSEEAEIAKTLFESLGEDQKRVLRLSIDRGFTHEVIAAQTGLPLGTVKTNIRRGLAQIREQLIARMGGSR
ncbi:MAG: sigma-70 family RNA polymerase sigma factor [Phycisphaerales bacterium]|jgi:RNA polymerase sigma-70 factor (ECF subfamily)